MASDTQIARTALAHLGDNYEIDDLAESSVEAEQVNLVFEDTREELLREHPWGFATAYVSPAPLSSLAPGSWAYAYAYPTDAVKIRRISNPLGDMRKPLPFEVASLDDGSRVILCNEAEPVFVYTRNVTNPNRMDALFRSAFSYRLAERLAIPLTGSRELMGDMKRLADMKVASAEEESSSEQVGNEPTDADWILARS